MQLTIEIYDDLLERLKQHAQDNSLSIDDFVNRALRDWLSHVGTPADVKRRVYQQETFEMGECYFDLTKASQLAAELEDEAIIEKLREGK